jgi:hypothetical protein
MAALAVASLAFSPRAAPAESRTAVRSQCSMIADESSTRRELFAKVGAAMVGVVAVDSASAKAGQFGKLGIFGQEDLSSPYQPNARLGYGGPTFGYEKSEGAFLAEGYEADVTREKASFEESSKRLAGLQPKIDSKTWWFIRDELRIQAYTMRSSMLALNKVLAADKAAEGTKAYKKFWSEIEQFDLACAKKEPALAQKEYGDVLAALKAYTALV